MRTEDGVLFLQLRVTASPSTTGRAGLSRITGPAERQASTLTARHCIVSWNKHLCNNNNQLEGIWSIKTNTFLRSTYLMNAGLLFISFWTQSVTYRWRWWWHSCFSAFLQLHTSILRCRPRGRVWSGTASATSPGCESHISFRLPRSSSSLSTRWSRRIPHSHKG